MIMKARSFHRRLPWKDVLALTFILVCSLAAAIYWTGVSKYDGAPIVYDGDALQYSYLIDASGRTGGLSDIQNAGAPFGTQHQDFPNGDWTNLALARALAPADEIGERFNRYYLFGFI